MGIDASIYSNIQAPKVDIANPLDFAEKGMRLSQLGMQQQQMAYQMKTMADTRNAIAQNTDPATGQVNQQGTVATLGKLNPMAAMSLSSQFAQQKKEQAEAQTAQNQAAHQTLGLTLPRMEYALNLPDDQAAKVWPNLRAQWQSEGVPTQNIPTEWNRELVKQGYLAGSKTKEFLENQMLASNVAKAPAELNAILYGPRGPNAELSNQYTSDVKPIRSSAINMNQMIDSYKNKTPQGDASLVLQNFKIRNPTVPDVNSIDEMKHSQSVSDTWKNTLNMALQGGFDENTRDNLMRDGFSAFRANYDIYQGIKERYQDRARFQNVKDPTLTAEPAIEKVNAAMSKLSDQLGAYVPPSQRGGVMGALSSAASRVMGIGGDQSAVAASSAPIPKGMIRVQGPDGKNRLIPASLKGEAIAAGGKVVR